eukprot:6434152-Prymnesium_polylepis.1
MCGGDSFCVLEKIGWIWVTRPKGHSGARMSKKIHGGFVWSSVFLACHRRSGRRGRQGGSNY